MAFPTVNAHGLNELIHDINLATQFSNEAATYMATIQNPAASFSDKQAAYDFFNTAVKGEGQYAALSGSGLETASSGFLQTMQTVLEKSDVQIPVPGGGSVSVYKDDGSGNAATVWDFISQPSASYTFRFWGGNDDANNGTNNGNNWWANSGIDFGRSPSSDYSGSNTTVTSNGEGSNFPGNGSILVHTDGEKCSSQYSFTCYANATTIEQYTTGT